VICVGDDDVWSRNATVRQMNALHVYIIGLSSNLDR
jgi:hypothetical protein